MSAIRLTQYSHGAGCGCKIALTSWTAFWPRPGRELPLSVDRRQPGSRGRRRL